ncbi:hypothetical protein [Dokdonella sp.]|uniref:hypothetical protein n=1 Tax=Dokdonella sp. TaxID=2291710 RepID=UPI003784AEDE
MTFTRFSFALCMFALTLVAAPGKAVPLPPGSIDPAFGDNGFVRLYYDDRLGATTDDSGRTIRIVQGDLGGGAFGPKWILVAGPAGRYVEITRLTMNGQIDPTFGANGVAFSARSNVASYGGMVVMPNGDIVIGYADDYLGPDDDSKDFFIEVFTADGQPKNVGGDESPNQRWVDLSNGNGSCNTTYRENRAQRLILTAEGGIVLVGDIANYNSDDQFQQRYVATAEFNGGSYGPARPGFFCTSAGGMLWSLYSNGSSFSSDGIVHGAVSDVGAHVLTVGSADLSGDGQAQLWGMQNYADLASGGLNHDYDVGMPAGYWQQRQSDFWQIRTEAQPGHFVLFGDAENGTFGGNVRRLPVIATTSANAMTPLWFYPIGAAADTAVAALDGQRLPGALDLMVIGGARDCTAANSCGSDWNSIVVGVSNGQSILNAYQPQPAFGSEGWVRHAVPDYDGSPATHALAWSGVIQAGITAASDTNLYVVGEFVTNADGHLDTFVAKLRILNGGDPPWYIPADTIFRDGFD